jgi:hypothetical protein
MKALGYKYETVFLRQFFLKQFFAEITISALLWGGFAAP